MRLLDRMQAANGGVKRAPVSRGTRKRDGLVFSHVPEHQLRERTSLLTPTDLAPAVRHDVPDAGPMSRVCGTPNVMDRARRVRYWSSIPADGFVQATDKGRLVHLRRAT